MDIQKIKELKTYDERYNYNIDKAVETKEIKYKSGKISKLKYLSWAYAQRIAKSIDKSFHWGLVLNENGSCIHENTVVVEMTFEGVTERLRYPILNNMNQPIANPTGADINNAQMRGMVKLFAMMSGIGLYLYTNEDIEGIGEEIPAGKNENKARKSSSTNPEEEKKRKENAIKFIIDGISNIPKEEHSKILEGKELIDLDTMNLNELKKIYIKIENIKKKGA